MMRTHCLDILNLKLLQDVSVKILNRQFEIRFREQERS